MFADFDGVVAMVSTIGSVLVLGILVFVLYEIIKEIE